MLKFALNINICCNIFRVFILFSFFMKNSKKWSIISLAIGILIFSAYFASSGHIPGLKSSALGSDFMCTQEGVERYMQQYDEDVAQRASLTTDVERLQLKNESLSQEIQTLQSNIQS